MRIWEGDGWKTAFQMRYSYFEYQVILFGFSNAPASFQGHINKILVEKLDVFVIVHLDDILIYIIDACQGHVKAVWWVLGELQKHGLFANIKKCRFHQKEVRFLSYIVYCQEIRMEEKKIDAVKAWPEPKLVQDIQVFIRFANVYWRFIQGFSKFAAPFTSMLKTSPMPGSALPDTGVDNSKLVESSGGNVGKLAKSDFINLIRRVEKPSFLTPNARRAFT